MNDQMDESTLGGQFTFPGTSFTVRRVGYGAMQLTGPGVFGPPKDPDAAVAILREAVAAGLNHIDTSDFYGPHVTNRIIRQALHPYPAGLVIVTKLGARRPSDGSWQSAISPQDLTAAVHDNLRNLGLDARDTDKLGAEFKYHYQDIHRCEFKITEFVPGRKVVWHVLDNYFNFVKDRSEWKGTDVVFEISRKGDSTEVRFTHVGLVPAYECYEVCSDAWRSYINDSLRSLITTGEGQPNKRVVEEKVSA